MRWIEERNPLITKKTELFLESAEYNISHGNRLNPGDKKRIARDIASTDPDRNCIIVRLSRLGWSQEKIAKTAGLSQNRISEIIGNTSFSEIDNLLSQGRDMEYIAGHYHMDIALVWALRLDGK